MALARQASKVQGAASLLWTPVLPLRPGGQLGKTWPVSSVGSPEPQGWTGGDRWVQASCQAPFPQETFQVPCPPRSHAEWACLWGLHWHPILPTRTHTHKELMPQHLAGHSLSKAHLRIARPRVHFRWRLPRLSPQCHAVTRS